MEKSPLKALTILVVFPNFSFFEKLIKTQGLKKSQNIHNFSSLITRG